MLCLILNRVQRQQLRQLEKDFISLLEGELDSSSRFYILPHLKKSTPRYGVHVYPYIIMYHDLLLGIYFILFFYEMKYEIIILWFCFFYCT